MKYPTTSILIKQLALEIQAHVELEPEFEFAGEIIFSNGKRHLFKNNELNINLAGSGAIAKDKGYTAYILKKYGFTVPKGQTFFSEYLLPNLSKDKQRNMESACRYSKEIGYPVIVKPNDLSQGILVCKVHNDKELLAIAKKIFERTNVMLVQEVCVGKDYRIVVLGNEIISAYERLPLTVIGDGISTIESLISQKKSCLPNLGRPNAEIQPEDFRIWSKLEYLGLRKNSILPNGEKITLLDNANLSTGGDAIDVTDTLHSSYANLAVKVSKIMGLHLCGVDIMCQNAEVNIDKYWIIEVNNIPGLDNYAAIGDKQNERVKNLYRKVLKFIEVSIAE
jgi:D-alanine-D-alanine ligase-like ATP-grasp enzyme